MIMLIKFFMLGNYIVCRDGFLTAIQDPTGAVLVENPARLKSRNRTTRTTITCGPTVCNTWLNVRL